MDDAVLDELYAAPLSDFVAVRDRLAADLKDSDDDGAAEVKRLKKPPVTAWAVNRLARSEPDGIAELLDASSALERALSQGDDVSGPTADRRAALALLRKGAIVALEDGGHNAGQAQVERVMRNLQFAASDPARHDELRRGVLRTDVEPQGIEAAFGTVGEDAAERKSAEKKRTARRKELEAGIAAAEEDVERAERAAKDADRAAAGAHKNLDAARSALESLQRRLDSLG